MSRPGKDSDKADQLEHSHLEGGAHDLTMMGTEPEYHTEESDGEDEENEEQMESVELDDNESDENRDSHTNADSDGKEELTSRTKTPLLPAHLLQPLPSPRSPQVDPFMSLDGMTRKEKKALRNKSRRAKKRTWERLRKESRGTGIIETGEVAQSRRFVVPRKKSRVQGGRVAKQAQVLPLSQKQKLLEDRTRAIQDDKRMQNSVKPPTRSKR